MDSSGTSQPSGQKDGQQRTDSKELAAEEEEEGVTEDGVASLEALRHLPLDDRIRCLTERRKALKKEKQENAKVLKKACLPCQILPNMAPGEYMWVFNMATCRQARKTRSRLLVAAKKLSQEDLLQVAAMKGMSKMQESANAELPVPEDSVDKSLKTAACTKPS